MRLPNRIFCPIECICTRIIISHHSLLQDSILSAGQVVSRPLQSLLASFGILVDANILFLVIIALVVIVAFSIRAFFLFVVHHHMLN
jgi:hypothetical protein